MDDIGDAMPNGGRVCGISRGSKEVAHDKPVIYAGGTFTGGGPNGGFSIDG